MYWKSPATSHFGVSNPHAWRFQGLFSQSDISSGRGVAAAGIANKERDAGAMLKSLVVALGAAVLSGFSLDLPAVLASFCCAQSGRANNAPITTVAHQLRIVSSLNVPENPLIPRVFLLDRLLRWTEHTWFMSQHSPCSEFGAVPLQ